MLVTNGEAANAKHYLEELTRSANDEVATRAAANAKRYP